MTRADDAPATRAEFLRDLAGHGFVPTQGWPLLANDRLGTALSVTPEAEAALTAAVGDAVDEFAAEFWALLPAERRRRWAGLSARAADGPTTAFLAHLEHGLETVVAPHPNPVADELAAVARELFVLRPRPRAVRRREWLVEKARDGKNWPATTRALQAAAPLGFDPPFLAELAHPGMVPRAIPGVAPDRGPANRPEKPAWGAVCGLVGVAVVVVTAAWMGANDAHRLRQQTPPTRLDLGFDPNKALKNYKPGGPRPAGVNETLWRLVGGDPKAPPPSRRTITPPTRR